MLLAGLVLSLSPVHAQSGDPGAWDPQAAAAYLDKRADWWSGWETAARESGTFCLSCHTTAPYGLARPMLRPAGHASEATQYERAVLESATTRVTHWAEIGPFYTDERHGPPKTSQSRGTEAILNALILAQHDARRGVLSDRTLQAFDNLWALQQTEGAAAGAWPWLHFNLAPWESDEGPYHGAALAAVAVGLAPDGYGARSEIQDNVARLGDYLRQQLDSQPPFNRAMALWASGALPDLLADAQRQVIVDEIVGLQREDGGLEPAVARNLVPAGRDTPRHEERRVRDGAGHVRAAAGRATPRSRCGRGRPRLARAKPGRRRILACLVTQPKARSGVGPRPLHARCRDRLRRAGPDGGRGLSNSHSCPRPALAARGETPATFER